MNNKIHSDVLIIGAGPGGYEVAGDLARQGKSVTLIEKDLLGGTCLNRGCIPTKALAATADILISIADAERFGISIAPDSVKADFSVARARAREVVDTLREGVAEILGSCTLVSGEARFVSDSQVAVDYDIYTADKIIIATGSRPAPLRCQGADRAITSDEVLALFELPADPIVIVGGGVIGLEFASILNAFGCKVSVVEFCKEVLPGLDPELAKRLRMRLARRGIEFFCSTAVEEITADGKVLCQGKKGQISIDAATVIAAVGRHPVIPHGLENTSITLSQRGFIEVDPATMQTAAPGVYAVGDVNGLCMLAHAAVAQAKRAAGFPSEPSLIPSIVFTNPQLASVGVVDGTVIKIPYASNGKALADGADGLLKLVCDPVSGTISGCHVIGEHAADLVAEATLAIAAGLKPADLAAVTHAHPSISELLQAAAAIAAK